MYACTYAHIHVPAAHIHALAAAKVYMHAHMHGVCGDCTSLAATCSHTCALAHTCPALTCAGVQPAAHPYQPPSVTANMFVAPSVCVCVCLQEAALEPGNAAAYVMSISDIGAITGAKIRLDKGADSKLSK